MGAGCVDQYCIGKTLAEFTLGEKDYSIRRVVFMSAIERLKEKSLDLINEKLRKGTAVVMTAHDFKESVRKGKYSIHDIDVVTTATMGLCREPLPY